MLKYCEYCQKDIEINDKSHWRPNRNFVRCRVRDHKYEQNQKNNNRDNYRNRKNKSERLRRKNNLNFKIAQNLRRRLRKYLKGEIKSEGLLDILGCSMESFRLFLESKFHNHPKTGESMTWDNYGSKWHLDHIYPISKIKLTDIEGLKKSSNFNNLQPLWAEENLKKSNKITQ
jgi:hypothetical protein